LKNKKNKKKKCATPAEKYRDWEVLAKVFAKKVKQVEFSQVDKLCSLKPSLEDPSRCFEQVSDNVNKICKSDECQELSQCWKNIYYMDGAMRQAESSCKFARQKLSKCRGYSTQIARRKAQLARCGEMQQKINIPVMPAL